MQQKSLTQTENRKASFLAIFSNNPNRLVLILSGALLFGLIILSQVFWKERVFFSDAAFQVYSVIVTGEFAIQVQRFGAALTQSFPLLGTELGWSLENVLRLYSFAFTFWPFAFFLILAFILKNHRMAIVLALYFGLMQVHSFYWIQNELIQANLFTIFLLGMISGDSSRWEIVRWILIIPLWGLIIYTHPLGIYALLAGTIYLKLIDEKFTWRKLILLTLLTAGILAYKHFLATTGEYDEKALGLFNGFEDRIGKFFRLDSTVFFFERLVSTYYIFAGIFISVAAFFIYEKSWIRLIWLLGSSICWSVLILTTYHWTPTHFYIESYFLTLSFLVALPLSYEILPWLSHRGAVGLIALIVIFRLVQIADLHTKYTERVDWVAAQVEQMRSYPEQRFLMKKEHAPMYLLHYDWAICYESLMLSAVDDGPQRTLYIFNEKKDVSTLINTKDKIPAPFDYLNSYHTLQRSPYFVMNDTLPARVLTPDD